MKLYELPKQTKIRVQGLEVNGKLQEELLFSHIDGMYSYCTTKTGEIIHLPAWTECGIV